MSFNYVEKAKGFIISPGESFRQSREDELSDAIRYFSVILTIFAALWGIITMVNTGVSDGIEYFVGGFIEFFIGAFISGAALQLSLIIIGGEKKGFDQALKVIIYGSTPCMLFGWIPILGIIAGFWSLVLLILGVRELYRISTARTMTVVILMLINTFFTAVIILSVIIMIFEDVSVPWFLGGTIFFAAVLALFDGGAYIFFKSWNKPVLDQQSTNLSVLVTPPSQQERPKENSLFFDRILTISSKATGLVVFGGALNALVSQAKNAYLDGRGTEAESLLQHAAEAFQLLKRCEEQMDQWEKEGYDIKPLRNLVTKNVDGIIAAFRTYEQGVTTLKEIKVDLQRMKAAHPAWMERPEFAPLVTAVEKNLKDPAKFPEVEQRFKELKEMVTRLEEAIREIDRLKK